jgi:hypothetical protein
MRKDGGIDGISQAPRKLCTNVLTLTNKGKVSERTSWIRINVLNYAFKFFRFTKVNRMFVNICVFTNEHFITGSELSQGFMWLLSNVRRFKTCRKHVVKVTACRKLSSRQNIYVCVWLKSTIFWDITPCSPLNVNRSFGGTYRLHLQDRRISRARNQLVSRWQAELCDMFPWNVGLHSMDYTALYPRREYSS